MACALFREGGGSEGRWAGAEGARPSPRRRGSGGSGPGGARLPRVEPRLLQAKLGLHPALRRPTLATSVLPTPGSPSSRMPLGGLASRAENCLGSFRNCGRWEDGGRAGGGSDARGGRAEGCRGSCRSRGGGRGVKGGCGTRVRCAGRAETRWGSLRNRGERAVSAHGPGVPARASAPSSQRLRRGTAARSSPASGARGGAAAHGTPLRPAPRPPSPPPPPSSPTSPAAGRPRRRR